MAETTTVPAREYMQVPGKLDHTNLDAPAYTAFEVSPGDVLEAPTRMLYVGSAGDLQVTMLNGAEVTFKGVEDSSLLPIRVSEVRSGTTASDIVGLV